MMTRNRSTCGVRPYIRCACNPLPKEDPTGGWLAEFIQWWWNPDTGYAIEERSGIIRWFIVNESEQVIWADTKKELEEKYPELIPKSFTFIPATIYDNQILLKKDPGYLANLMAQDIVTRERLLKGNWKIRPQAGLIFKREWFEIIENVPRNKIISTVRYWDRACTLPSNNNKDPDFTSGLKFSKDSEGYYYVEHVSHFRGSSKQVRENMKNIASSDGTRVRIGLEQEPGASGKTEVEDIVRMLAGHDARAYRPTGDKVTRAMPASAQAEAGNIKIVRGAWNDAFLNELENFDGDPKKHDDQVDTLSGAFTMLSEVGVVISETYAMNDDYINVEIY
jgi:predicted phage terminase large subunit-like protein